MISRRLLRLVGGDGQAIRGVHLQAGLPDGKG